MSVSCQPTDLIQASKCFAFCLNDEEISAVEIYLWTKIAGASSDVSTLIANAKCLESCIDIGNSEAIIVSLLANIAGVSNDPRVLVPLASCIMGCMTPDQSRPVNLYLLQQIASNTETVQQLLDHSRCFRSCVHQGLAQAIKIWLIAQKAGVVATASNLISLSNCLLGCLDPEQLKLVETYLLCQIANPSGPVLEVPQTISGLTHWWRADSLVGIVADGGKVGGAGKEWVCKVTGIKASQANAALQPFFKLSWTGGQPAIRFTDAVVANYALNFTAFTMAGDVTVIAALQMTSPVPLINEFFPFFTNSVMVPPPSIFEEQDTSSGDQRVEVVDNTPAILLFTNFVLGLNMPHSLSFRRTGLVGINCEVLRNNANVQGGSLNGNITVDRMAGSGTHGGAQEQHVAEILHYNNSVSNADLTKLYTTYLQPRYSL